MINKENKNKVRSRRASTKHNKVFGTSLRPRLSVHRSLTNIYAQIIDDEKGITLVSASTLDKNLATKLNGKNKKDAAFIVGETIGALAKKKGVSAIVFDRAGYLYTGRVQALADGARKAGLKF